MPIFLGLIGAVLFAIIMVAILAVEDRDKRKREEAGLPPKKYGDITDHDVTTVYTIRHKRD